MQARAQTEDHRSPERTERAGRSLRSSWGWPQLGVILVALFLVSFYDYPAFHTVVELFCLVVASAVFIVVFNTRRLLDNDYLLFVSFGLLAFVVLGIPHVLAYKGVQLLPGFDNDLPTQAFIAQRFVLAGTFLLAPFFLRRRVRLWVAIAGFGTVTVLLLLSLLVWRNFPHMFVNGVGLTPLKKALEYVLCVMFAAAAVLLWVNKERFDRQVLQMILVSLGCFVVSEFSFTLYATPYGLSNLSGHLFQVAAFWFMYRAVIVTALVDPFALIFRDLARSEASLAEANEALRSAEMQVAQELTSTTLLLDSAASLIEWTDLRELGSGLAETLLKATTHTRAIVDIFDEERRELEVVASAGEMAFPVGSRWKLDDVSEATRRAIDERRTIVADMDALKDDERGIALTPYELHLLLYVPLVRRDSVVGLVLLDDPGKRSEFTEREIAMVEAIAAQAAVAIENARLLDDESQRGRFSRSMAEINTDLASSLDIDKTLPSVLHCASEQLGAAGISVADTTPSGWRVRHVVGLESTKLAPGFTIPEEHAPGPARVLRTREPHVVPDVSVDPDTNPELARKLGYGAYAMYPLVVRGEVTGVITAFFDEPHVPSEFELDYLRRVAFAISLTEENSRLYMAEHLIADRLQEALLTLPETVASVDFAHSYHSATDTARVGGDFYDLFELRDGRVCFVIGDVAGKGLEAAMLTSMIKNTIRAHAHEAGKTPGQVLTLTNEVLHKTTPPDSFVTAFVGMLSCAEGKLSYANAGHTTAALINNAGVLPLCGTGPIIGAFDDMTFEDAEACLGDDGTLFLYTDGVTEARRDGQMYGEERLFGLLGSLRGRSAEQIVESVVADVSEFAQDRLRDDLAILVIAPRCARSVDSQALAARSSE